VPRRRAHRGHGTSYSPTRNGSATEAFRKNEQQSWRAFQLSKILIFTISSLLSLSKKFSLLAHVGRTHITQGVHLRGIYTEKNWLNLYLLLTSKHEE